jgi:hypothetical protein
MITMVPSNFTELFKKTARHKRAKHRQMVRREATTGCTYTSTHLHPSEADTQKNPRVAVRRLPTLYVEHEHSVHGTKVFGETVHCNSHAGETRHAHVLKVAMHLHTGVKGE